jgi:hypothetical protein
LDFLVDHMGSQLAYVLQDEWAMLHTVTVRSKAKTKTKNR